MVRTDGSHMRVVPAWESLILATQILQPTEIGFENNYSVLYLTREMCMIECIPAHVAGTATRSNPVPARPQR